MRCNDNAPSSPEKHFDDGDDIQAARLTRQAPCVASGVAASGFANLFVRRAACWHPNLSTICFVDGTEMAQ